MQSAAAAAGPATNAVLGALLIWLASVHDTPLLTFETHARFWAAVAFLGFLQLTAAVLNLLPIPGLDGYAIVEPYLDPETVRIGEKVKPWGLLGVILILQVQTVNTYFFRFVYWLYDLSGSNHVLAFAGHMFFRFWAKPPA